MLRNLIIVSATLFAVLVHAEEPDPNWNKIDRAVWQTFSQTPHMIDNCALKLAHKVTFDRQNDWPAYCNTFENTSVVINRINELKNLISTLRIPSEQLRKLAQGRIWVGAKEQYVILSWGTPKDINRTITANTEHEQWVYDGGYIYLDNGIVSGIQN